MKYIAIAATALSMSNPAVAQTSNDEVQQREDRWVAALSRGDVPSLAAMYEDDAWLVLPGAPPAKGRPAIADTLRTLAHGMKAMKLQSSSVVPLGPNTIVEDGVATLRIGSDQTVQTSNYQVVWRRTRAGGWKILRDMVSPR